LVNMAAPQIIYFNGDMLMMLVRITNQVSLYSDQSI
jgi:hypothetical protein